MEINRVWIQFPDRYFWQDFSNIFGISAVGHLRSEPYINTTVCSEDSLHKLSDTIRFQTWKPLFYCLFIAFFLYIPLTDSLPKSSGKLTREVRKYSSYDYSPRSWLSESCMVSELLLVFINWFWCIFSLVSIEPTNWFLPGHFKDSAFYHHSHYII